MNMQIKRLFLLLPVMALFLTAHAAPLPRQTGWQVIIDTDGAIDDMRALTLLFSRPEVRVEGILLSDGSLTPADALPRIRALLHRFGRDSVPVACGPVIAGLHPAWREFNKGISWEGAPEGSCTQTARDLFRQLLSNPENRTTLLCLGALTNIAPVVQDTSLRKHMERIIWYNPYAQPMGGFNYEADPQSAETVLASPVKIALVSNTGQDGLVFDTAMVRICRGAVSIQAHILANLHSQPSVNERLQSGHFRLADELAALYLLNPELFDMNTGKPVRHRYDREVDVTGIREAMADLISDTWAHEGNVVFSRFPSDRQQFAYDVRQVMDSAIHRYGPEEWKANVMTDEFHGHLGVFSIVGAKMGIRAREYFGVGPDEMTVVTYAGLKPPYSCLTDGIQVSTGATLGMGTITVATGVQSAPSADFTHKGKTIRITLKPEYLEQVNADINEGIIKFGMADDGYWKLVRRNAIRYWLEWDRNRIFTLEMVNP